MLVLFLLIILTDGLGKVWVCCEMAITAGREMQLDEKKKRYKSKNEEQSSEGKWTMKEKNSSDLTLHYIFLLNSLVRYWANDQ